MKWLKILLYAVVAIAGELVWARGGNSIAPPPTSFINVATLPSGAVSANSLSPTCFSNPAGTVFANSNWTALSTQYLASNDNAQFVIKSKAACAARDINVTTWVRDGYVYLRVDGSGNAIYFDHNGETTNGTLVVGIVTGLDESSYPGGTYTALYANNDLVHTVAGYNKTDTTGA